MKKIVLIFMLLTPMISLADRTSNFIKKVLEYEKLKKDVNSARINAYAVNQEKLDIYRAAHPRYNFPESIKNLNEKQAKQILDIEIVHL